MYVCMYVCIYNEKICTTLHATVANSPASITHTDQPRDLVVDWYIRNVQIYPNIEWNPVCACVRVF